MWQPATTDGKTPRSPQFLPAAVGILIALAPLGLVPLLELDPLDPTIDARLALLMLALVYPGWVAATAVRSRSVGPVIVVAALVPALALAAALLGQDRTAAEVAGDLDAFLALALPPAILGAAAYGLIELAVAVIQRIDPAGGARAARSVAAAVAGLLVSGALVGVIGWLAFGVVGFRLTN